MKLFKRKTKKEKLKGLVLAETKRIRKEKKAIIAREIKSIDKIITERASVGLVVYATQKTSETFRIAVRYFGIKKGLKAETDGNLHWITWK